VSASFASAAAQRLATDLGLDDITIIGTGRGGKVTLADVRDALPSAPSGLSDAGARLWLNVQARWQLRPDEETILREACRTVDELSRLEAAMDDTSPTVPGSRGQVRAHPLVRELREHRLALRQLLGGLGLSEADAAAGVASEGQLRSNAGRQLARKRWSR
jgi:hypothetical protein